MGFTSVHTRPTFDPQSDKNFDLRRRQFKNVINRDPSSAFENNQKLQLPL